MGTETIAMSTPGSDKEFKLGLESVPSQHILVQAPKSLYFAGLKP